MPEDIAGGGPGAGPRAGTMTRLLAMFRYMVGVALLLALSSCGNGVTNGVVATASPHFVALSWTASTSSGISGYNMYRGTQSGGPYALIGSVGGSSVTYQDKDVAAGDRYYYVVTAFIASPPAESVYSNEAAATVPSP